MDNLHRDLQLVFTSARQSPGASCLKKAYIYDDFEPGSGISPTNFCITSGNLTVMNMSIANSAEHPDHCPSNTYITMQREKGSIKRMELFHAHRNNAVVRSPYRDTEEKKIT